MGSQRVQYDLATEQQICIYIYIYVCVRSESRSAVSDSLQSHTLYSPWDSPGQNTGVGSLFLLQGIFPTQESNWCLLHCRQILYQLSYQGMFIGNIKSGTQFSLSIHNCPWTIDNQILSRKYSKILLVNSKVD